jgi:hypothetical protein
LLAEKLTSRRDSTSGLGWPILPTQPGTGFDMAGASDYSWYADDSHPGVKKGVAVDFSTARAIQGNDGYGGSNWEFSGSGITVHVHFQGVSRRVSVVRIKSVEGGTYDENIIKIRSGATGVNLGKLSYYCKTAGFPDHSTFLKKLHQAMPPSS